MIYVAQGESGQIAIFNRPNVKDAKHFVASQAAIRAFKKHNGPANGVIIRKASREESQHWISRTRWTQFSEYEIISIVMV